MSRTIIVLDANVLMRSPRLRSPEWERLRAHQEDWRLAFVVPSVALMETVNGVRRRWRSVLNQVESLTLGEFGLTGDQRALSDAISAQSDSYEEELTNLLNELSSEFAPVPTDADHMTIARRASERRAPYQDNRTPAEKQSKEALAKDGYRDTLIWFTVLDIAARNPNCDIWFVSDNYSDFGARNEGSKDPRDSLAYPLAWHSHLLDDLEHRGLSDRVFYARGLERLEQHLASHYQPLSGQEQRELVEAIDSSSLSEAFDLAVIGLELGPRAAALPLDTVIARVIGTVRSSEPPSYFDVARRGAGSWTAQFTVELDAMIEVVARDASVTEIGKKLQISGSLSVDSSGSVTSFSVQSAESLPDDPMRKAWKLSDLRRDAGGQNFDVAGGPTAGFVNEIVRNSPAFNINSDIVDIVRNSPAFNINSDIVDIVRNSPAFNINSDIVDIVRNSPAFNINSDIVDIVRNSPAFNINSDIVDIVRNSPAFNMGAGWPHGTAATAPHTNEGGEDEDGADGATETGPATGDPEGSEGGDSFTKEGSDDSGGEQSQESSEPGDE